MGQISQTMLAGIEETSTGKFEAPDNIIQSVGAARSIYFTLRTNNLKRVSLFAEIEGLVQGNPPYNPQKLREAGLEHIANFNDMSAMAVIERACLAYWNLLNNSQYLINFELRGAEPELATYAQTMSKNWDEVVKEYWPSFLVNLATLSTQLVKFGLSPVLFADERDPRWRVVEVSKFLIPDQTQSDLDLLTTAFVETDFTVQYLWGIFKNYKDKTKEEKGNLPWNIDELGRLLVLVSTEYNRDNTQAPIDPLELERRIFSGDFSFTSMYADTVRIVSLFQEEYSGKISHYMFHRNIGPLQSPQGAEEDFLFFEPNQFENMNEALVLFTMNPGSFTIHANRGVGHKIYPLAQAKTQTDCSIVDLAKWASTPIIKSSSLNSKDVEQIRFYPGVPTNIGTADFMQNNLGANIDQVIGVSTHLQNAIQYNISYSGSDPANPDPDQGSIAPSQTRLQAFREFSVLKNNIMHFYFTFDRVLRNMVSKMWKSKKGYPMYEMCKEWKERCVEDGVPQVIFDEKAKDGALLPRRVKVAATRAAGAGSQVAHLIALQELQAIAGSFGPREEREYKKQYIMATTGPETVSTFLQEDDRPDEEGGGASLAGVENAIMQAGKSPVFSLDNEHRAHFATHMALNMEIAQGLQQQQIDPVQADSIFNVAIPHTQQHLMALEKNPFAQAFFQQAQPAYQQVEKIALLNRKNAQTALQSRQKQQQEAQAQTQQVMSEEQLKNYTTMQDERRKDIKLAAQAKRQEEAGEAKRIALEKKTDADIVLKDKKVTLDAQIDSMEALLKNENDKETTNPTDYQNKTRGKTISLYDFEKQ